MILADIGNRHIHIYEEGRVLHLEPEDAVDAFGERIVYYISVSDAVKEKVVQETYWRDISDRVHLPGEYEGMGVDRRALCLSRGDGLYLDAGSALTLDRVEEGRYQGGLILPGLHSYRRMFAEISPVLDREPDWGIDTEEAPKGTPEQISYGIIAPIVHEICRLRGTLPLYVTGGDGRIVASWFEDALYSETLVFEGMMKALKAPSS